MRRHDLVTLHPGSPFTLACQSADAALWAAARHWIDLGRPLVAARQPAGSEGIHLGLTLPSAQGRQRCTCIVGRPSIAAIQGPRPLADGLDRLPAAAAVPLGRLAATVAAAGASIGIFGSLAWELVSGESYRHDASDIDVICDIRTRPQYDVVLAALARAAAELPCRLDGEVRFPGGDAVAWRELHACPDRAEATVLAKGPRDVRLLTMPALFATLTGERRHG